VGCAGTLSTGRGHTFLFYDLRQPNATAIGARTVTSRPLIPVALFFASIISPLRTLTLSVLRSFSFHSFIIATVQPTPSIRPTQRLHQSADVCLCPFSTFRFLLTILYHSVLSSLSTFFPLIVTMYHSYELWKLAEQRASAGPLQPARCKLSIISEASAEISLNLPAESYSHTMSTSIRLWSAPQGRRVSRNPGSWDIRWWE
jgi:hypothetical protein